MIGVLSEIIGGAGDKFMSVVSNVRDIYERIKKIQAYNNLRVYTDIMSNSFTYVKGRMFDSWVDQVGGNARNNGFDEGDLIECPAYIIESLLRDENFVERDLSITTVTDYDELIISGLASSDDDYYNNAIYYNVTTNATKLIIDYIGATKTIILENGDDDSVLANDNVVILNIQGDLKVEYSTFDAVGNTTNGTRKDWIFAKAFIDKQNIIDMLDELCFECHCEYVESSEPVSGLNKFKLIDLDSSYADTWTNPAYGRDGLEQISVKLSSLDNVLTKFRLRYFYDYGKSDYLKEIYVDKNSYPASATILSATEQTLCANAETNYKVSRLFEYSSRNIYDDETAERMLQKKIEWFTKQRLIVTYISPIVGNKDFIKYEIGDKVRINYSKSIPTGINNSSNFIISAKKVTPLIGGGYITWELIEL